MLSALPDAGAEQVAAQGGPQNALRFWPASSPILWTLPFGFSYPFFSSPLSPPPLIFPLSSNLVQIQIQIPFVELFRKVDT